MGLRLGWTGASSGPLMEALEELQAGSRTVTQEREARVKRFLREVD